MRYSEGLVLYRVTWVTHLLLKTVTEMVLVSGHCVVLKDRDCSTARYTPMGAVPSMTTISSICRGYCPDDIRSVFPDDIRYYFPR